MPVYTYRGTNRAGAAVSGEQSASNKADLINLLRRQQIKVSKLSEKGKEFSLPTFKAGVNAKDLAVFTRQFSVMIDAGLPLVQCLEILAGQQENKTFESVLTTTRASVEGGYDSFRGDAAARESFRCPLCQSGRSWRSRWNPGYDSSATRQLH